MFHDIQDLNYSIAIADGGDFVPAEGDSHRAEIANFLLESMGEMEYDAIGVGEMDLAMGPAYLREAAQKLPLLGANVRFGPGLSESLLAVRWVERKGHTWAIIGIIDPMLHYETPGALDMTDSLLVSDARIAIQNALAGLNRKPDMTVLLLHAEQPRAHEIMEGITGIDMVVVGHEPMGPKAELKMGDAFLVLPGPRSREVSLFTLTESPSGQPLTTDLRVFRLANLTKGDPKLEKMTRTFMAQHGLK